MDTSSYRIIFHHCFHHNNATAEYGDWCIVGVDPWYPARETCWDFQSQKDAEEYLAGIINDQIFPDRDVIANHLKSDISFKTRVMPPFVHRGTKSVKSKC